MTFYSNLQNELNDKTFPKTKISNMTTDYLLRTYTAGCYYLDEKFEEWSGKKFHEIVVCEANLYILKLSVR